MMSAPMQWAVVALIVVVCAAYALRALMPAAWRRALAGRLRAAGLPALAERLGAGDTGCAACSRNPAAPRSPGH